MLVDRQALELKVLKSLKSGITEFSERDFDQDLQFEAVVEILEKFEQLRFVGECFTMKSATTGYARPVRVIVDSGLLLRGLEHLQSLELSGDVKAAVTNVVCEWESVCQSSVQHLIRCRELIGSAKSTRELADGMRDAISAMEALLKKVSGKSDIHKSIEYLKESEFFEKPEIGNDGKIILAAIHVWHPGARHGHPDEPEISKIEAMYWVERALAYIKYVAVRAIQANNENR